MAQLPAADRSSVLRKVNQTLRGPVLQILGELVPDVQRLPKDQAFDLLLADLELLARCFQAFNANPDHFKSLLVDRHKVPVEDAEALLECGRSLEQVVSMVVRTAAKRYFRSQLDQHDGRAAVKKTRPVPRRGLLHRLRALLSTLPDQPRHHPMTRGEMLYKEFQDYLRHDWQVPMIPEYSQLPPSTVRKLGARILDYRLPEDIRRLRANPDNPPAPTPLVTDGMETDAGYQLPAALSNEALNRHRQSEGLAPLATDEPQIIDRRARLQDILSPDGRRLKPAAFTPYLLDPKVRAIIPNIEHNIRLNPILSNISGVAGRALVAELGFSVDQLAVFLMSAYGTMGEKNFFSVFGIPGRSDFVTRLIDKAKGKNIGHHSSLPEISDFISQAFTG